MTLQKKGSTYKLVLLKQDHRTQRDAMLIILLGLILALLPLILTTAYPHLVVISIYAGMLPWLAIGWAAIVMTVVMRRQRIAEWREKRKRTKQN